MMPVVLHGSRTRTLEIQYLHRLLFLTLWLGWPPSEF